MWLRKINPLIYAALFAVAGVYIGIVRLAAIAVRNIASIFAQANTLSTVIDVFGNIILLLFGLCVCAGFVITGIYVTAIVIDHRLRR